MSNKTFTAAGKMDDVTVPANTEVTILLGLVDAAGADVSVDLGGSTILICMKAEDDNGYIPVKPITSLSSKDDKASRYIFPAQQQITVIMVGGAAQNLYAEIKTGERRNP